MANRKTHHIVPASHGGWNVRRGGSRRASRHFERKDEAEVFGRQVSRHQGTELVIHGMDGKIQTADSHGQDPNPPKDKD